MDHTSTTSVLQTNMKKYYDCYNQEFIPGCKVAYNRSGEVKIGNLISIRPKANGAGYGGNWHDVFATIKVQGIDGKVSTLTRLANLVIIP